MLPINRGRRLAPVVEGLAILLWLAGCTRYEIAPDQPPPCQEPPQPAPRPDSLTRAAPGTLAGRVVVAETGEPLGHAVVAYRRVGAGEDGWQQVRTDSVGRFEAALAWPGRYDVRVLRIGFLRRVDVLARPDLAVPGVLLPMSRSTCGDLDVIVLQPKPWWKFW